MLIVKKKKKKLNLWLEKKRSVKKLYFKKRKDLKPGYISKRHYKVHIFHKSSLNEYSFLPIPESTTLKEKKPIPESGKRLRK